MFEALRDPKRGEAMVRVENVFLDVFLPRLTMRALSDAALDTYREPFTDPASRGPLAMWPRELAIDGEPVDMVERARRWNHWLSSSQVPKLALYGEPGAFMPEEAVRVMKSLFPRLAAHSVGPGLHFLPESQPDEIGRALSLWIQTT